MSNEEMNRAIAEVCGDQKWRQAITNDNFDVDYIFADSLDDLKRKIAAYEKHGVSGWYLDGEPSWYPKHNYTGSLDAMHEAEKKLCESADLGYAYDMRLQEVTQAVDSETGLIIFMRLWHATAPQRAEAFLRAVGRWQEKEKGV